MSLNHYSTLKIATDSSVEEIRKAFAVLALKYHSENSFTNNKFKEKYRKICEAYYDLLQSKGYYDQLFAAPYEERLLGLNNGDDFGFIEDKSISCEINLCEPKMEQTNSSPEQLPPVIRYFKMTLNNVLNGCTRDKKVSRKIMDSNGNEKVEYQKLVIHIKPGTEAGTRFVFPHAGDQCPGKIAADIIVITKDKPDDCFKRRGANLEYVYNIKKSVLPQVDKLEIPILVGSTKSTKIIPVRGPIDRQTVIRIPNCGLPFPDNSKRGDIVVKFKILKDTNQENSSTESQAKTPKTLECTKSKKCLTKQTNVTFKLEKEKCIPLKMEMKPLTKKDAKFKIEPKKSVVIRELKSESKLPLKLTPKPKIPKPNNVKPEAPKSVQKISKPADVISKPVTTKTRSTLIPNFRTLKSAVAVEIIPTPPKPPISKSKAVDTKPKQVKFKMEKPKTPKS